MKTILRSKLGALLGVLLFLCVDVKAQYCAITYSFPCSFFGVYISNVTLGPLNNSQTSCGTTNFTTTVGDTAVAVAGSSNSMSVSVDGGSFDILGVGVYIDFNSNGSYADAGEELYTDLNFSTVQTYSFNIAIPAYVPDGYYHMRVWSPDDLPDITRMCTSGWYFEGDYHDYIVHITNASCDPYINLQPISTARCAGGSDTFTVGAIGTNLTYQWLFNGQPISGANAKSLLISNIDSTMGGGYSVLVSNSACSGTGTFSDTATLTVNSLPIIYNSGATTFCPGDSVTLTSSASTGNQWTLNGTPIFNAINQTYVAHSPGVYRVIYTNVCPSYSRLDTVSNYPAPSPVISPSGSSGAVRLCTGSNQLFTTQAGSGLTYQWSNNGINLVGANDSFFVASVSGQYTVTSMNSYGCTTTSSPVQLQINGAAQQLQLQQT